MNRRASFFIVFITFLYGATILLLDVLSDQDLHAGLDVQSYARVHLAQEAFLFAVSTVVFLGILGRELVRRGRAERLLEEARQELERRVDERTRELATLLEVARNVASTLELQPLLGLILDQVKLVVDYTGAAVVVQDGNSLATLEQRGPMPGGQAGEDEPAYRRMLELREPIIIPDLADDTPLAQLYRGMQAPGGSRSWMAVPLIARECLIGLLRLDHVEPGHFTPQHAQLLTGIANQAATAIENARLYAGAQKMAALEERQYLARELHDSISQVLYGVILGARTAAKLIEREPEKAAEPLDYITALADMGLKELRGLIYELRPETLGQEGLLAALIKYGALLEARYGLKVDFADSAEPQVSPDLKEELRRIAQEALYNVVKHARADRAWLRLAQDAGGICLEVGDNGTGFDPKSEFPGHYGLQSMHERSARLGGTLSVTSAAGQGTQVRLSLPASRLA